MPAAGGTAGLTVLFTHQRATFTLSSVLLVYFLLVVVVARLGGPLPGGATGVAGFVLTNWYFVSPQRQLAVSEGRDLLSLGAYLVAVGIVVALAEEVRRARRTPAQALDTGSEDDVDHAAIDDDDLLG
ncbi:MAG: DUF4118 domain-containing protein [Actinomycetota bacterium]|nr:DUF4118 domain-containing protein [Actinomycetota bacterium]